MICSSSDSVTGIQGGLDSGQFKKSDIQIEVHKVAC